MKTNETNFSGFKCSGFLAIVIILALLAVSVLAFRMEYLAIGFILLAFAVIAIPGLFTNEPNNARVMVFFGKYKGSLKTTGFFWVNPFYNKRKLTQRARNLDVEPIKVNDKAGNPVMIGLVLVWKIMDT